MLTPAECLNRQFLDCYLIIVGYIKQATKILSVDFYPAYNTFWKEDTTQKGQRLI